MARNINRVCLTGNLTRDPELRHTPGGMAVCELSLAVNGSEKVGGEWRDRADFFDLVVFGNSGESAATYMQKGTAIGIDGRLRHERWETKEGEKRSRVKVVVDTWMFLSPKGDGGRASEPQGQSEFVAPAADFVQPQADFTPVDDDIPF